MQLFKGNAEELKVIDAVGPVFDSTSDTLDQMYANGSTSAAFILMLYDNGFVSYSQRISRAAFVSFYLEALNQFQVIGTFEAYLFILRAVFGDNAEIFFETPTPGTLAVSLNIETELTFDLIGSDDSSGVEETYELITQDGSTLACRAISGFETEHDIDLLFSEITPVGIYLTLAVNFYEYSNFVALEDSTLYDMVDYDGNNIVFYEIGA